MASGGGEGTAIGLSKIRATQSVRLLVVFILRVSYKLNCLTQRVDPTASFGVGHNV